MHILLVLSAIIPINAQQMKSEWLSEKYYDKWNNLQPPEISDDGEWVASATRNRKRKFNLFLINTGTDEQLNFPGGKSYKFIKGINWFTYSVNDTRYFLNLSNLLQISQANIKGYRFLNEGKLLLILTDTGLAKLMRTDDQHIIWQKSAVQQFEVSEHSRKLFFLVSGNDDRLLMYSMTDGEERVIKQSAAGSLIKFVVDNEASALAWIEKGKENSTLLLRWGIDGNSKTVQFDLKERGFPLNSSFQTTFPGDLRWDHKHQALIFDVLYPKSKSKYEDIYKAGIEQWNGSDPILYPHMPSLIQHENTSRRIIWWPDEDRFVQVTTPDLSNSAISPSLNYALLYNSNKEPALASLHSPRDLYLFDLHTGVKKLWLEQFAYEAGQNINLGPRGKYIVYYKNKDWWLYNVANKEHINITAQWKHRPIDEYSDDAGEPLPAFIPVWDASGKYLFINDFFDLHVYDLQSGKWKQLTEGRDKNVQYHIDANFIHKQDQNQLSFPYTTNSIDLNKGVLLHMKDLTTYRTGFCFMSSKLKTSSLLSSDAKLDFLNFSKDRNTFIYRSQSYDQPQALWMIRKGKMPVKVIQTNEELLEVYKPKIELVHYKGMNNERLKGLLYYPLSFNTKKRYPLVVHIYERLSQKLHTYYNPDLLLNHNDFNPFELLRDGYFVFMPDINYVPGEVRQSTSTCVLNGLDALKNSGIDKNNMGLEGFSYGGYQTALIATVDHPFKTIVSGAPFIDPMSDYFNIGRNLQAANYFFFETHQTRQRGSFFDFKDDYYEDSVLTHSDKINVPILIYAGGEDGQIDWRDSLSLYLSLRRQQKPIIFLKYLGENHTFQKEGNSEDVSNRVRDWFDYHLKNKHNIPWMNLEFKNRGAQ